LWFPAHQTLGHFWEDQAEEKIAKLGYPTLLEWYTRQTKLTLAGAPSAVTNSDPGANFDHRLTVLAAHVGIDPVETGRGIIPIELTWRKEKSLGSEYLISLRLADEKGHTWAIRDSFPQAGQSHFTDLAPGDTLIDHHGLLVPAGTPPGQYQLLLSVRRSSDAHPLDLLDADEQPLGTELTLSKIDVIDPNPPIDPHALPVQSITNATFDNTVKLIGYSLGHSAFKSGETLPLTLFWQSQTEQPGPLTVSIQLKNKMDQPVVIHEQQPIRPTTDWSSDTLLHDPHNVFLPPTLPPGEYQLVVGLLTPEQTLLDVAGGKQFELTSVTTIDRPHNFEVPEPQIDLAFNFSDQIELAGLDVRQEQIKAGEYLPLTLHWKTMTTPVKAWTVFVHLLDQNGDIVAQQDQIPGDGQFPTTGWLPDEYIADDYNLLIPTDTLPGEYILEIGLYDANDFSRLPVVENGEIVSDHVVLESWPISVE
jgi:hypothetical protein